VFGIVDDHSSRVFFHSFAVYIHLKYFDVYVIVFQMPGSKDAVINAPIGEEPAVDNEPDLRPKAFGPKSVFTPRKLGNYEPAVVKQTGPG